MSCGESDASDLAKNWFLHIPRSTSAAIRTSICSSKNAYKRPLVSRASTILAKRLRPDFPTFRWKSEGKCRYPMALRLLQCCHSAGCLVHFGLVTFFALLGDSQHQAHRFQQATKIVFDLNENRDRTPLRTSKRHSEETTIDHWLGLQTAINRITVAIFANAAAMIELITKYRTYDRPNLPLPTGIAPVESRMAPQGTCRCG